MGASKTHRRREQPPAERERGEEAVAANAVGDSQGFVVFLAAEGDLQPMLVRQRVRRAEDGQRLHRIDHPVGGRRLAEDFVIEQVRDSLRQLAVHDDFVDEANLKEPLGADLFVSHCQGERRVGGLHESSLELHLGIFIIKAGPGLPQHHFLAIERPFGLGQSPGCRGGFAAGGKLFRQADHERGMYHFNFFEGGAGFDQRRIDPLLTTDEVSECAVAERFFHHVKLLKVSCRVSRFQKVSLGGVKLPLPERQLAELEQPHAGAGMIVGPARLQGVRQLRGSFLRLAGGGISTAKLQGNPRLRPVVRRPWPALKGLQRLSGERVMLAGGAENFRTTGNGQGGAADDFADVAGIKLLRHDDPAVLSGSRVFCHRLSLHDLEVRREVADLGPPLADSPGHLVFDILLGLDGRELDPQHPVPVSDGEFDGGGVLVVRIPHVPHLVVALADHGVEADGVDPSSLGAVEAGAGRASKHLPRGLEVPVVERAKAAEIADVGNRHPGNLGLGGSGAEAKT